MTNQCRRPLGASGSAQLSGGARAVGHQQALAEGLAPDLKARGVDMAATAPGPVRSGFAARARMTMGATDSLAAVARGTLAALGRRTTVRPAPLSRLLEWALAFLPRRGRARPSRSRVAAIRIW